MINTGTGSSAGSRGWRWHVVWVDGPSETAMDAAAERVLRLRGSDLAADTLAYLRTIPRLSVALAMVRNVRLGRPALGEHRTVWELEAALRAAEYPEQGSEEDRELAAALARITGYNEQRMPATLDQYGLAGLRAEIEPPDNVVPLFPGPQRWHCTSCWRSSPSWRCPSSGSPR